jgi:signal transduction histidine kinase/ActR/RegA family two-component response regulator
LVTNNVEGLPLYPSEPEVSAPVSNEAASDPSRNDERGELAIFESVRYLGLSLVCIFAGYVAFHAIFSESPFRKTLMLYDGTACLLAASIVAVVLKTRIGTKFAHPAGAALVLITAGNIALSSLLNSGAFDLAYMPFLLVIIGALMLSPGWVILVATLVVSMTIPVALHTVKEAHRVNFFITLFTGLALMGSVFLSRLRAHRRVLQLREMDRRMAASLRDALERSEQRRKEQQFTDQRRQELEEQLRQSQKLEAVGVLAGGVAHDMNNVLGVITSIASLAGERFGDGESLRQDLADILAAARRGSALTRNLLGFARQGTRIKERFRLETIVESITHLLRRTISKQIELRVDLPEDLDDIIGDPGQLSHVLMNLCINAVDAMQGRGLVTISATNVTLDEAQTATIELPQGKYIELRVVDTGKGIAPDVLPRVFEPFFSTKNSNERSGLGLSMVYGTVRDHGGTVHIESTLGTGTKVAIYLPSQIRKPASVAPPSVHSVHSSNSRRTILLVDDEPLLRSAGRRIIRSLGYDALVAANGAEAVAVFRMHLDNIGLVVLDVAMPVMGGRDCFFRLRELDPDIPVLVASGFAKHGGVDELLGAGATGYLAKPYDRDQMSAAIHRCLALSMTLAVAPVASDEPHSRPRALP